MEFDNVPTMGNHSKPSIEAEATWLQREKSLYESKIEDAKLSLDVCNLRASHRNVDDIDLYELANSEDNES